MTNAELLAEIERLENERAPLKCVQELCSDNLAQLKSALRSVEAARVALALLLKHSCVADADPNDKDEEDHAAERWARSTLAALSEVTP